MSRKIAIKTAAIAVAVGAITSVAWAESIKLTDAQMDQIAAGELRLPPNPYRYAVLGVNHPGGVDFGVLVLTGSYRLNFQDPERGFVPG